MNDIQLFEWVLIIVVLGTMTGLLIRYWPQRDRNLRREEVQVTAAQILRRRLLLIRALRQELRDAHARIRQLEALTERTPGHAWRKKERH